jgi:hypothetical protein
MNHESKAGTWWWVGLATSVVAWDLLAPETISHAFHRGVENPRTRALVLGGLALTAAHLVGDIIPENIDPFHIAFERVPHIAEK